MEFIEREPLPEVCLKCEVIECDCCDNFHDRFIVVCDEEKIKRNMHEQCIRRMERRLREL